MRTTSKLKFFLKKHSPEFVFKTCQSLYNKTIARWTLFLFTWRSRDFTKEMAVELSYFGHSFKLLIDPRNEHLDKWIYVYRSYEQPILNEIKNNTNEGDTLLDIGANIGHHSLFMSRLTGVKGQVIAFEPISHLRSQFRKSVDLNHIENIDIKPYALGNKESDEEIYVCESNVAGSSLVHVAPIGRKEVVHILPLDTLSLSPSFMKIDVEGYEYFVLIGGEKTIQTFRPKILLEYSPLYYWSTNPSHQRDIVTFLRKHDYDIYDIEDGRRKINDDEVFLSSFAPDLRAQTNLICIPR